MLRLPCANAAKEACLLHKPPVVRMPRFLRVNKVEVEIPDDLRDKFRHLHQADVLTQTGPRAYPKLTNDELDVGITRVRSSYLEEVPVHCLRCFFRF